MDLHMEAFFLLTFVINSLSRMWGGELFVPKIPSYRLVDVANAIAPDAKHKIIGIDNMHGGYKDNIPKNIKSTSYFVPFIIYYLIIKIISFE